MYQYSHSMFMGLTLCKEYQKLISKKRNNVAREIPETGYCWFSRTKTNVKNQNNNIYI